MERVLALKGVCKIFGTGHTKVIALEEVDFSIQSGEFVAIVGPSGSGKSTFLSIVAGLQNPTSGEVIIGQQKISAMTDREKNKMRFEKIGFILQSSNLIPFLKVKDQLRLIEKVNSSKKDKQLKKTLLKELDIEKLVEQYPQDLSGGEKQRVAIACSMYHNPQIILADEPTASLDTKRAFEVVKILAREAKEQNKAIIMVTHDDRLLGFCDRIMKIEDGFMEETTKKG